MKVWALVAMFGMFMGSISYAAHLDKREFNENMNWCREHYDNTEGVSECIEKIGEAERKARKRF